MVRKIEIKYIILMIFVFVLFIIGSFFDLAISKLCYFGQLPKDNFFGVLFSYIGVIPTFLGWSFLGTSIIVFSKKEEYIKWKRHLFGLSILLYLLSFFFFCNSILMTNKNVFNVHWTVAYGIGILGILLSVYFGYLFTVKCKDVQLLKEVLFLIIITLIVMVITMATKEVMSRPRFRFVLKMNNYDFFINWWENGKFLKSSVDIALFSDEFSSFPSGHSSYSMFAIFIFPLLAKYNDNTKKYSFILFVFGVIWWWLTAFSRITVGAHYLTDVCVGGIVTILSYMILVLIENKFRKKKLEI